MKLFFVAPIGKAESQFIHADTPTRAAALWSMYYDGDGDAKPTKANVFDVSQTALCESIMPFNTIPMTVEKVP